MTREDAAPSRPTRDAHPKGHRSMNEVYDFDTVPVRRSLLRAIETARVNVWKHGSDGGHVLQLLGMLSRLPNPDEEPKP